MNKFKQFWKSKNTLAQDLEDQDKYSRKLNEVNISHGKESRQTEKGQSKLNRLLQDQDNMREQEMQEEGAPTKCWCSEAGLSIPHWTDDHKTKKGMFDDAPRIGDYIKVPFRNIMGEVKDITDDLVRIEWETDGIVISDWFYITDLGK